MSESKPRLSAKELEAAAACGMSPGEYRAWSVLGVSAITRRAAGLPLPSRTPRSQPLTLEQLEGMSDEQLYELNRSDLENLEKAQ
jgi:hypothetical protein